MVARNMISLTNYTIRQRNGIFLTFAIKGIRLTLAIEIYSQAVCNIIRAFIYYLDITVIYKTIVQFYS